MTWYAPAATRDDDTMSLDPRASDPDAPSTTAHDVFGALAACAMPGTANSPTQAMPAAAMRSRLRTGSMCCPLPPRNELLTVPVQAVEGGSCKGGVGWYPWVATHQN